MSKEEKSYKKWLAVTVPVLLIGGVMLWSTITSDGKPRPVTDQTDNSLGATTPSVTVAVDGDKCDFGQAPSLPDAPSPLSDSAASESDLTVGTKVNIRSTQFGIEFQGTVKSKPYIIFEEFSAPSENQPSSDSPIIDNRCVWAIDLEDQQGDTSTHLLAEMGVIPFSYGWNPTIYTTTS